MKLLLDEHLSKQIAVELRSRGHDAVAIQERSDLIELEDREVLRIACSERRAVVTANVQDFRPLAAERAARDGHSGLVLIPGGRRSARSDIGRLVAALDALMAANPGDDDLANREEWISASGPAPDSAPERG